MHPAVIVSARLPAVAGPAVSRSGSRWVGMIPVLAAVLMLAGNLLWRKPYTGDEGFYGVTAQNMLVAPEYLLRPSYHPEGDFVADRGNYAHPPFNSYLYALGLWAGRGSLAGPEVINALAFAVLLYFAFRLAATFDARGARFAVLLLAASPSMMNAYTFIEAEPLMTALGVVAVYGVVRSAFDHARRWSLFAAGLCLGFSFALKLWLCGPLLLAVAAALAVCAWRRRPEVGEALRSVAVLAFGFAVPAALHLAVLAWLYSEDLEFWVRNVYFGVFLDAGISGSKLAGAEASADWVHPAWYYGAALYREHFFLWPPIALGGLSLLRERRSGRRLLPIVCAGALGVIPLSLFKVKEPLYVLGCAVFLYLLAGSCLASLERRMAARGVDRSFLWCGLGVTVGPLVLVLAAYARQPRPDGLTPTFVALHTAALTAFAAGFAWACARGSARHLEKIVYGMCAAAVVGAFAWKGATQPPRDETIVRIATPYLRTNAPGEVSFVASNFKNYQYRTFRSGCYWHELPAGVAPERLLGTPDFRRVRVFILDPEDQLKPANVRWLRWLESHAVEKTAELDRRLGVVSGFRLFVRD